MIFNFTFVVEEIALWVKKGFLHMQKKILAEKDEEVRGNKAHEVFYFLF